VTSETIFSVQVAMWFEVVMSWKGRKNPGALGSWLPGSSAFAS
jgi:hypothetical protein